MASNFTPFETVPLTASNSSSAVSFGLQQSKQYPDVMVQNVGSVTAFIGFSTTAALPALNVVNGTPIPAGAIMVLKKGGAQTISGITASGSAQLYFTSGEGQ